MGDFHSRTGAVFQPENLAESCGGDAELMRELLGIFVTQSDELGRALQEAIAAADTDAVRRHAHKWAGSCASCGLPALTDALRALEHAAEAGCVADCAGLWAEARRRARTAAAALRAATGVEWNPECGTEDA
jgi:HPt (histidine-containing phosphotransfer) domain-containing protein